MTSPGEIRPDEAKNNDTAVVFDNDAAAAKYARFHYRRCGRMCSILLQRRKYLPKLNSLLAHEVS
ncbi:MAG: hypothetical protein J0H78_14035 [Rhizobiales bacterium]|nr:hypothetical protein [Hyphomicrobiales bacterium]